MEFDVKKKARAVTRWVGSIQSVVVHTIVFAGSFTAVYFGALTFDRMLLVLTTIVSLEAIYLAIFIQMTINEQAKDIDEIQEDIEEIQEDVEEMSEEDKEEEGREAQEGKTLGEIHAGLQKLMQDIEKLRQK